jgi:DNA (cytosine-5)-methyltransferase 1
MKELTYIDLFAGAGGLSEGFIRQGFLPAAHVEYDVAACYTLKTRIAYHYLKKNNNIDAYHSYIKGEITRNELYALIPEERLATVVNAKIGGNKRALYNIINTHLDGKSVDLIIGGPPCQAYSVVGRAPLKNKVKDERTTLYIQYGHFLKRYNPKVFVFENVPGILTAANGKYFKDLTQYFKSLGYIVEARILNAYDYGVVQHRERVIVIGWQKGITFSYPEIVKADKKYYLKDIFSDLPAIKPGEQNNIQSYAGMTNEYLDITEIRNGVSFVSQHITRPHNDRDLAIYKLAIKQREKGILLKNDQIPEKMRTQLNVTDFLDRFKVVGNEPHTMIAHIAKDGHHFIHPDIKQLRSISIREAARIQSFPDDYYFEGSIEKYPRTAAFRQIGNAVPPLMAEKIAGKIKEMLNGNTKAS